jgi:glycosyltransferase involved in cell wall biosynthesis
VRRSSASGSLTVLHVSQPGDGGVASYVRGLVADQVQREWRVVVATPDAGLLSQAVGEVGATALDWNAGRAPNLRVPFETVALARTIAEVDPDVVHLHSSKAGLAGRLALRSRRPTVFQPHGWSFEAAGSAIRRAVLTWERFATRWSQAIVCVSDGERARGNDQGIRGRFQVIPSGVDVEFFARADEDARRRARVRLGLASGPLVVCVGRISHAKGQDRLVATWPTVREQVPEASLALVGGGEDEQAVRLAAGSGVQFAGHQTDVREWLAAADVVAQPSRWEGMALSLLEAMATGRSVVATDVGGSREALAGVAGAAVHVDDTAAFANELVRRLREPELRLAEEIAAAERARERYDLRLTTGRVASLYTALLDATATAR